MSTLNFNHLTRNPRLCIKSKTDGDDDGLYANDQYFIYCSRFSFTLIHKNGDEQKLNIKRKFPVLNICWSSYLQKFFVLSGHGDQKLYLLDPIKQQLKVVKSSRKPNIMHTCTCHDDILLLGYAGNDIRIEEYRLSLSSIATVGKKESLLAVADDEESSLVNAAVDKEEAASAVANDNEESIIKLLAKPVHIFRSRIFDQITPSIEKICFNSNATYLGLITYLFDDGRPGRPEEYTRFELNAFRHTGDEMTKIDKTISVSGNSYIVAVPDGKFLVLPGNDSAVLTIECSSKAASTKKHKDRSGSSSNIQVDVKEHRYSTQSPAKSIAICGTCLAMKTYDNEIHIYEL